MSSPVGRALLRDGTSEVAEGQSYMCCSFTNDYLATITARAKARGETPFDSEEVIDHVVAPIAYRILVSQEVPTPDYCKRLIDRIYPPA